MADLGTIGIAIEVRGREALRQIESDMGIVDKTAKSAARSFEAFERAGLKTADTFRYMSDASKKRLAEEQKITQELIKQRSAAEQLARANAQKFQSQIGSNLGLGAKGISAGASAGAFEAEIERLRQKYDQIYASSQLYERSLTELNKAHALGVLSTKQHESALESLNAEYQNFQNGAAGIGNRFAQNVQQNMAGVSNAGVLMQQLGYQAGDFIVQVQSGTNAFVAFGQQATQMVGFLPMLAQSMGLATVSVLGFNVAIAPLTLGLSIIIPLLTAAGAAFMRSGGDAKSGAKGISDYEAALKGLQDSLKKTQVEIDKLSFGTEDPAMAAALRAKSEAEANLAIARAGQRRIGNTIAPTAEEAAALREAVIAYNEMASLVRELEEKNKALEEAQRMLNGHLSTAKSLVAAEADERARHKAILDQINATENERKNIFHALAGESESVSKYMDESFQAGLKLSQLDMATPISDAAVQAQILADKLGISVGLAAEIGKIGGMTKDQSKIYSGVKSGALPPAALNSIGMGQSGLSTEGFSSPIQWMGLPPNPTTPRKKSGGGGGSKTDPMEELRQQIKLQNELLGVSEAQERVLKALGDDRSKYSQKEIDAVTAEIEAYNQKKEAIERTKDIMETVSSSMEDAFMSMVDGTKSAKDAFKSMAAEILKELYRVLVVQRMVSAISGAFSFASGPSTGSFGLPFGGANASGGSMVTGKSYLVGENGPELVIPRHSGTVVNANQTAAMGGGSEGFTQNLSINVTGSDAAMVRTEVAKMIPQITNATKSAIIDAKQRGGQMAAAFR